MTHSKLSRIIILCSLAAILLVAAYRTLRYERMDTHDYIILEIAPRDPRAIFQGDYMDLRFSIVADLQHIPQSDGYLLLARSPMGVDTVEFISEFAPTEGRFIKYTLQNGNVDIGLSRYFFQERRGDDFAKARYAQISQDKAGKVIIENLLDENLMVIQ